VDDALEEYWKKVVLGVAATELQVLFGVLRACSRWLKDKEDKSDHSWFNKKANGLFIRRRNVIANLATDVLGEIERLLGANANLAQPNARERLAFDRRKVDALRHGAGSQAIGLSSGYEFEQKSYLDRGKQKPISGSGINELHKELQTAGSPFWQLIPPTEMAAVEKVVAKKREKLTMTDWETIERVAKAGMITMYGDVVYMAKGERLQFMVFVDRTTGNFVDANGHLLTRDDAYAMDSYGNMFVKPNQVKPPALARNGQDPTNIIFNHSSFNAGRDVLSAGEIKIENGVLKHIDNTSGHYKPTEDNLRNCVQALNDEGLNLSQAEVVVVKYSGSKRYKHFYKGSAFRDGSSGPFQVVLSKS
jgi:hypothetical protein